MKFKKFDSQPFGIAMGLLGPVIGYLVYSAVYAVYFNKPNLSFINDVFLGMPSFRSSILTISLLFNLIPFFIFIRTHRYKSARGVLLAVFMFIPFVVYFRFFQ